MADRKPPAEPVVLGTLPQLAIQHRVRHVLVDATDTSIRMVVVLVEARVDGWWYACRVLFDPRVYPEMGGFALSREPWWFAESELRPTPQQPDGRDGTGSPAQPTPTAGVERNS